MRWSFLSASALLVVTMIARTDPAPAVRSTGWNAAAAAHYLDDRMAWWRQWPKADRDHDTKCVSCHTSLPHTLARPSLRSQLGETRAGVAEMAMFDDVSKRVWIWKEAEPFYPDQTRGLPKSSESRGVEAVLNALVLATRDQERGFLGADTRQAFTNMWGQQMQSGDMKGGFAWLNFHLEPFESPTATYWGATLAALAVARAPGDYGRSPAFAPQVEALRAYLRTGLTGQSLYTRALVLWADSAVHGVMDDAQRQAILRELVAAQGKDDGWSLPSLSTWRRIDSSALPDASDGYATSFVALVMREAGMASVAPPLKAARSWLIGHQDKATGAIPAQSINKDRKPGTDAYLFMTDEATGMAALALRPDR